MTKRRMLIGLIGANIQGSMSPALFADAFAAAGIDGYYHLLDADRLAERRLPQLLGAVKTAGFAGVNVTYPFKQDIIPLLDAVDPEASEVGAVNTISIASDGRTTATISIAAAGATVFSKSWGLTAPRERQWCRSAPAALGALLRLH